MTKKIFIGALWALSFWLAGPGDRNAQAVVPDSYLEDFDGRLDGATINGVDSWTVMQGDANNAMVKSGVTFSGSGKALELKGAPTTARLKRPQAYGHLSPTWIRFKARPSAASQTTDVPATGIAAISYDYTGKVLASDGASWADTGRTYSAGRWYDVALKVNFETRRYDFYFTDSLVPDAAFVPVKSNLKFINSSINSLSGLGFFGSYSTTQASDVYIDNVAVTYIDRLAMITVPQKLLVDQIYGPVTVQLQNALSEPQTTLSDMVLELKSTSTKGKFSATRDPWKDVVQITIPQNAQNASFYYKDSAAGKPLLTASESPDQGFTDASQQLEIVNKVSYFDVRVATTQVVAGESFKIKITAQDENGQILEGYNGTVNLSVDYLSPPTGRLTISPESVTGFVKGTLEASVAYPDCGLVTFTVADTENPTRTGTGNQVLFLPARFSVTADSPQTVSKPFSLKVTAQNVSSVTTPNYNGNVNLTPLAVSPPNTTPGSLAPSLAAGSGFENGTANVTADYRLYGTIKIRVEDQLDKTKQGISGDIAFLPQGLSISVNDQGNGRDFFYIGEPVGISVKVVDALGQPILNYPGVVTLNTSTGLSLPSEYTFVSIDAGQHIFSAKPLQIGSYTVVVKAEGDVLRAESPAIKVKGATLQVINTTSPLGTGEIVIQLVDDQGNVITKENNLTIGIKAIEDVANNSVSLSGASVRLREGRAIIPISNSEAEIVTIIPSSTFKIKVKKGTITFGRAGKTGMSTIMWRELKGKK